MSHLRNLFRSSSVCCVLLMPIMVSAQEPSTWKVKPLTLDANEGCALGDIDGNGSLDVVAGRNWYPAPDFVGRPLRNIEDWNGYVQSNGDFLFDMNGDGRLDEIAGSFVPTEVHWYENPGAEPLRLGQTWPKHLLVDTKVSENEGQLFTDLDGDGRPEWVVNSWNPKNPLKVWRLESVADGDSAMPGNSKYKLVSATLAESGNSHGLGVGDLNGDHRLDVLTGSGWYEHPSQDAWGQVWKFHADWQIQASIPMIVSDIDGDGLNDIVVGHGHDYGLHFWRQIPPKSVGEISFDKQVIDKSFSQPHAIELADLNGDGVQEIITGKRYFAHNGGDPGAREMPLVVAFQFDRSKKSFDKWVLEQGHVGIGLQVRTGDLDGDGSLDIAVAGKSGTYVLFNPTDRVAEKGK